MARKLKAVDTSAPKSDKNELSEIAIFECLSGTYEGRTRVVYALYDLTKSEDSVMYGPSGAVLIISPTGQGTYPLDKDTKLVFDEDRGLFTFSSSGIEYMIRAIENGDIPGVEVDDNSSKDTKK